MPPRLRIDLGVFGLRRGCDFAFGCKEDEATRRRALVDRSDQFVARIRTQNLAKHLDLDRTIISGFEFRGYGEGRWNVDCSANQKNAKCVWLWCVNDFRRVGVLIFLDPDQNIPF